MKILFITLVDFRSIDDKNLYADLMREFAKKGHDVFIVSPFESRFKIEKEMIIEKTAGSEKQSTILKVKIGNIQKTNIIEKGISTILVEYQILAAVKKHFKDIRFDLVLYSTPPITIVKPISFIRKRDKAKTFLMLKDIFPQNAIDLGMLTTTGLKGILSKMFRNKEKKLYQISDYIGCMSQANVDFLLKHNPQIAENKVSICPNGIEVLESMPDEDRKKELRKKYGLSTDKTVFVYGGNLGKPQGIPFIIECLKQEANNEEAEFLIVGSGTEFEKLNAYIKENSPANVRLLSALPKEDYEQLVSACDVGLIFLDYRFTIPNFPSRLLSYMQSRIPVLAATDKATDIGKIIEQGNFGLSCSSDDVKQFSHCIERFVKSDNLKKLGENGYQYLLENYTVSNVYASIVEVL
jgi:glycosyltransferase involved in cell wall biosynthesis